MRHIDNGFGGTDEQAMIDQFHSLYGRDTAERLDRIMKSSYPAPRASIFDKPKTAMQVFEARAKREGFHQVVIDDFRKIAS